MAEGKKKVIWYTNWCETFEKLSEEEAGRLIKHFCEYITDKNPEAPDRITDLLFDPIKDTLKRDLVKWEVLQERNRINGAKGGRPNKPKETEGNPEEPSGLNINPKKGVTVTDSVTDKVNDTDRVIVNDILIKTISSEIGLSYNENIAFAYWKLFKQNYTDTGITETVTLDKAKLGKWSNTVRLMMDTDKRTKDECELVFKFLRNDEFWKKTVHSVEGVRKHFEKLFMAAKAPKDNNQNGTSNEEMDQYKRKVVERIKGNEKH